MHGHVPSGFGRRQPHGEPVMVPFPLLRAKGRENLYIYKWGQIFTRCNASEMQGSWPPLRIPSEASFASPQIAGVSELFSGAGWSLMRFTIQLTCFPVAK